MRNYKIFHLNKTALCLLVMMVIAVCTAGLMKAPAAVQSLEGNDEITVHLPVMMAGYFEGAIRDGISGRVMEKDAPSSKTLLKLRFNDGFDWSTTSSTLADAQGGYRFLNVDPLQNGQEYYVRFGPNTDNAKYVLNWYGPTINEFSTGDSAFGGVFDIADVPLISPKNGAFAQLPVTFSWQKRNLPGETYRIAIYDEVDKLYWRTIDLGDVSSVQITALASDLLFFRKYAWYVEVYMGEDNFGESYKLNDIVFLPPVGQQSDMAAGESLFMRGSGRGGR